MSAAPEIPSFLDRRNPQGQTPMTPTPQTAPKPTKTKRKDALNVTIKVQIPLDMTDSKSLAAAIDASEKAKAAGNWPAGSIVTGASSLGKV